MLKISRALLLGALLVGFCSRAAWAADSLGPADRQAAVGKLSAALRDRYVYPEVGARAADRVTANLQAGAYDALGDPAKFAVRLTEDVAAFVTDKHFQVRTLGAPLQANVASPPAGVVGIVRADRLAGGVGYIEIATFPNLYLFKPFIDRAMRDLADSKALIIDVRRNGGGDWFSVAYLASFFLPPGHPVHINGLVSRQTGTTTFTRQTIDSSATPVSFAGKPVIILTSSTTFSGGEEFPYDAQALRVATIIGETTAGAANTGPPAPLGFGLTASIPVTRVENSVTGTNWSGKGVVPDVAVPAPKAFRTALERLGVHGYDNVAAASRRQVVTPPSAEHPGSALILRRLLEASAKGAPDYSAMGPELAESTRKGLSDAGQVAGLGAIGEMKFRKTGVFGDDDYDVSFANGVRLVGLLIGPDGKVLAWGFYRP